MAIKNRTKPTLYDELIEQLPMEMGELLEEARAKCKRWHFEQIGKYTNALDATYERIWQLGEKDKEEEDIEEGVNEEATQEKAKQVSLSKEDEDETKSIDKLIRKQEVVIDPRVKGKAKEQKVGNKDQVTIMDGEWIKTRMKKMIYGNVAPRVKHPTLA